MRIPKWLVWSMRNGCAGVEIYCAENLRAEVASCFENVFEEEYIKLMDLIEREDGSSWDKDVKRQPFLRAEFTDFGILLLFRSMAMYTASMNALASHDAGEALVNALEAVRRKYPSISYEGYVAYWWCDSFSGDIEQYDISSGKRKDNTDITFDFIGRTLNNVLKDENTWENLTDALEDYDGQWKEILKFFHLYSDWIPEGTIERFIDLTDVVDVEMRGMLEEYEEMLKAGKVMESDPDLA